MPELWEELLHVNVLVLLGQHAGQRSVLGLRRRCRFRRLSLSLRRFGRDDGGRRHQLPVVLLLAAVRLRILTLPVILVDFDDLLCLGFFGLLN